MSETHDLYTKLSGHEALAWINTCVETWRSSGVISTEHDSEALTATIFSCKPVGFKNPRRSRAKKSSSSERSSAEYQSSLEYQSKFEDSTGSSTFVDLDTELLYSDQNLNDPYSADESSTSTIHKNDGTVYYPHDEMKTIPPNSNTFRPIQQVDNILKINGYGKN